MREMRLKEKTRRRGRALAAGHGMLTWQQIGRCPTKVEFGWTEGNKHAKKGKSSPMTLDSVLSLTLLRVVGNIRGINSKSKK